MHLATNQNSPIVKGTNASKHTSPHETDYPYLIKSLLAGKVAV